MAFNVLQALGLDQIPARAPIPQRQTGRLPDAPPPRRGGPRRRGGIGGLADMVNSAYASAAPVMAGVAGQARRREAEVDEAMAPPSNATGSRLLRGVAAAAAPYIDVIGASTGSPELGRSNPDTRGAFLRKAYETYKPSEGYYALPRSMGAAPDPEMFTNMNYSQSQIDNARRKFVRTHKWARNKKSAADVDVAVKYLLEKGHQGYV